MTENVIARQLVSILKNLTALPDVKFIGNSDVFYIDCDKISIPKYEFRWIPVDGRYNIYIHQKLSKEGDRSRNNCKVGHLFRVLDAADFIIAYKFW